MHPNVNADSNVTAAIEDAESLAALHSIDEESFIKQLVLHLLTSKYETTRKATVVDGTGGEVSAEQYIQKRAEYRTVAETGSEAFYTTTPFGRTYFAYMAAIGGVFTVNLCPD
jgi:hypothetical protein